MAMKISFTFIEVFADVSMKSKLLSSAYDCASCEGYTKIISFSSFELTKQGSSRESQVGMFQAEDVFLSADY